MPSKGCPEPGRADRKPPDPRSAVSGTSLLSVTAQASGWSAVPSQEDDARVSSEMGRAEVQPWLACRMG